MRKSITYFSLFVLFCLLILSTSFQASSLATSNLITSSPTKSTENLVATSPENVNPLLIGANIPDVTLKSIENKEVNLLALVKNKPTVFIFYRGGW